MIIYTNIQLPTGKYAVAYRFPKRGDGVPMHSHDEPALEHSVACTRGRVAVYGPGKANYAELSAGEELHFDSSQPHEVVSLQDESGALHVLKGHPEGFDITDTGSVEPPPLQETI